MEQTVVAIIGCGTIANSQHLPQTSSNPSIRIKYAVDVILERAKAASEKYKIEKFCTDYREALNDKEVVAVMICTPNYMHYTIAMDAMKAGKNVFCEKPITVNAKLSAEMAEYAFKHDLIFDIGVCNRFNKSVELIKMHIERGDLGEVYHTYNSFRSFRCIPGLGGDFTTKAVSGGGALIDWGVHFIDLTLYCLGLPKVKTVSANCYNKLGADIPSYVYTSMWAGPPKPEGTNDVEEFVTGYIRTASASISFNGAWAQNIGKEEMFVDFLGDKAGIRLDYGGKFTMYGAKDGVLVTSTPDYAMPNAYYKEVDEFAKSIKSRQKTANNIMNVLETMKVLDAIYLSSEKDCEIKL